MGGVLFIDEAYYLYKPENERDYGQESIEILLQVMENNRDDLVVVLAGYKDKMDRFFESNPGMRSRIGHHLDFPDYSSGELKAIADLMLREQNYRLSESAELALQDYIPLRMKLRHFSNARSIRNALDRARLRQAARLFARRDAPITKSELMTIEAEDIRFREVDREAPVFGYIGAGDNRDWVEDLEGNLTSLPEIDGPGSGSLLRHVDRIGFHMDVVDDGTVGGMLVLDTARRDQAMRDAIDSWFTALAEGSRIRVAHGLEEGEFGYLVSFTLSGFDEVTEQMGANQ